jgi:hypothetical protein
VVAALTLPPDVQAELERYPQVAQVAVALLRALAARGWGHGELHIDYGRGSVRVRPVVLERAPELPPR